MLVGQKIGPFAVDKELGSGAMGTVYLARHLELKMRMALKIMAPGLSSEVAQKRFKREADILKQLKHPNIVRFYGVGKHQRCPYYAMEYIEGESLEQVLARRGRISWEDTIDIVKQLCAGLQHAHEHGIIHRDLKPANIMLLPPADGATYGKVKLTDFGIAKDLDATQYTAANCTVGTASYMSPEQCRGEPNLTNKSDLYSLGVTFFELLTGRKPFLAETVMEMFKAHESQRPPRVSRIVLEVPIWLDTLIFQLMEKEPDKRPYDANAVIQALDRIKEKVEAQKSAGIEAATMRRIDRSGLEPGLDETDKEIARTLLNKKKKKKNVPFYTKGWFVGAAVAMVLAAMGFLLYWVFIKPPSADSLYYTADTLRGKDPAEARSAMKDFLHYYPDHSNAKDIRRWADEIDLTRLEGPMYNRRRMDLEIDGTFEKLFRQARNAEERGDFDRAADLWRQLSEHKDPEDTSERAWHLLAQRNLADLRSAETDYKRLEAKVRRELERAKSKARKGNAGESGDSKSDDETQALDSIRSELIGDNERAHDQWMNLKKDTRDDPARRRWHLLAAWCLARSPKSETHK